MKCSKCKKNALVHAKCKCEKIFCLKCRMPEDHSCEFNFQEYGKQVIQKQNPIVIAEKVKNI